MTMPRPVMALSPRPIKAPAAAGPSGAPLVPIEIQMQRGFFTYFVEDIEVFDAAFQQARELLPH